MNARGDGKAGIFTLTKGMGGIKLVRIPVKAALHRIVFNVKKNVGSKGGFGTIRANNPSNNYLARGRLSLPVSCSGLLTTNSVVKSKKVVIVSRSSYVITVTGFCLSFAIRRSYNGYTPYQVNGGQLRRVLRGVASNGKAVRSLRQLHGLTNIVGSATLYNLKRASPGPILSAVSGFCSRCLTRIGRGHYPSRRYHRLARCFVGPRGYGKYALYTQVYPIGTVAKSGGIPRIVSPRAYVQYNSYVREYGFNTVCIRWDDRR